MVKRGLFGLSLVRAETIEGTRDVFDVHKCPKGEFYAEVEPESEYYVQVTSDATERVYADISVDGVVIERGHPIRSGTSEKIGIVKRVGTNTFSENALCFIKPEIYSSKDRDDVPLYWTGEVTAEFYGNPVHRIPSAVSSTSASSSSQEKDGSKKRDVAAVMSAVSSASTSSSSQKEEGTKKRAVPAVTVAPVMNVQEEKYKARPRKQFYGTSLSKSDVGYVMTRSQEHQKKGVKSAEGQKTLRAPWKIKRNNKPRQYECKTVTDDEKEPEKLGSITVRYCSTIGLIAADILPKPPFWALARVKAAYANEGNNMQTPTFTVTKIKLTSESVGSNGKVTGTTEVDFFDLTDDCDDST